MTRDVSADTQEIFGEMINKNSVSPGRNIGYSGLVWQGERRIPRASDY
jgi:hypothetical protein